VFQKKHLPFLPRDAMRKRGLCFAQCPSVRPSVTFMYCIQTAEDILKLLSRPGSPIITVFWSRAPVPNSKGNAFSGGAKYTWWGKFAIFDWNRRLSRKGYEIRQWLLWNANIGSHSWRIDTCRFWWPWVTLKCGTRASIFQADLLTNALIVWPRTNSAG